MSSIDNMLLYIDNNKHALAKMMEWIRWSLPRIALPITDRAYYTYQVATIDCVQFMLDCGDVADAHFLTEELNGPNKQNYRAPKDPEHETYWLWVYNHYLNKHLEGVRMEECLGDSTIPAQEAAKRRPSWWREREVTK